MSKIGVIYFIDKNRFSPVKDVIDRLDKKQQDKISRAIYPITEFGLGTHLRNTRKITGTELWEIRILGRDSIRVIYAIEIKGFILILNVFIKKTQKTPYKEIKIAENRLRDFRTRNKY